MTTQELLAEQIERIGDSLAHYVETTAPDRLSWRPSLPGSAPTRSALEQVAECVGVNRAFAALLRGDTAGPPPDAPPVPADAAEARAALESSCAALAATIRACDDATLDTPFPSRRGPRSGKSLMVGAYRNMAYHCGQVNLIQMLAGDSEFHAPASWG